jgi:hypothetical protein
MGLTIYRDPIKINLYIIWELICVHIWCECNELEMVQIHRKTDLEVLKKIRNLADL